MHREESHAEKPEVEFCTRPDAGLVGYVKQHLRRALPEGFDAAKVEALNRGVGVSRSRAEWAGEADWDWVVDLDVSDPSGELARRWPDLEMAVFERAVVVAVGEMEEVEPCKIRE